MALENEGFIELYDLTTKAVVSRVPLSHIKFVPRAGERILISPTGAGDWRSYTVADVEYFLNYDPSQKHSSNAIGRWKNHALRRTNEAIFNLNQYP